MMDPLFPGLNTFQIVTLTTDYCSMFDETGAQRLAADFWAVLDRRRSEVSLRRVALGVGGFSLLPGDDDFLTVAPSDVVWELPGQGPNWQPRVG